MMGGLSEGLLVSVLTSSILTCFKVMPGGSPETWLKSNSTRRTSTAAILDKHGPNGKSSEGFAPQNFLLSRLGGGAGPKKTLLPF
jgi:hypothetical protein